MNSLTQSIITLVSISLIYSFFYFYIYIQNKHRYLAIWGFGWIIYSLGYLFSYNFGFEAMLFKYSCSIMSSAFLLLGTLQLLNYSFYPVLRRTLVMTSILIAVIILITFRVHDITTIHHLLSLPVSLMVSIISVFTGIVFLVHDTPNHQIENNLFIVGIIKDFTGWMFIIWGMHKGYYSFVNPNFFFSSWNYISSIILTNILNISIILTSTQQNNIELAKREQLYRLLAEHSQDLIIKFNVYPQKTFSYISPSVLPITGYSKDFFYKDYHHFYDIIYDDDKYLYLNFIKNLDESNLSLVFRMVKKDSKIIWIEQHTTIICDEENKPISFEAILRDITQVKENEEKVFKSETSRRQLLANISHELRTPITSIIGYLSLIVDNIITHPKEQIDYIKICLDKSVTLNVLIEDLFELSKLEADQLLFDFKKIDVNDLMAEIYNEFKFDVENINIKFTLIPYNTPDGLCPNIWIDKTRIIQVFRNLIHNSINNITNDGKITISCKDFNPTILPKPISINPINDYILFTIKDNGIGISKNDLPNIFERFYRKKTAGIKEGTGLGLSISKEIVKKHNGEIWAFSEENVGTTIYIILPIEK
ncbi:MAG: ATP-binding protein [Clostridia bacterium]|nr:ATP-binding protein [Clostridia bacterium]